jgi:phosphatidylserine/phosphatidylglycerophosphate/cardiolipin synthase-like enzyme
MRRRAVTSAGLLLLVLAAASYLYRDRARWLPTVKRSPAPVATPGAAPIEGPYFSDGDRISERIIAAINHTKSSLDLAIFDLTHPAITAALEDAQRRGVRIRIVADKRQSGETHSEIPFLTQRGIPVRLA